jgi:hypothetical protein
MYLLFWRVQFGSPTSRTTLEHMPMMKEAVEHRADGGCISQKFPPVFDRAIRSQHRAGPFIPSHDDLQQFFGSGQWLLAHPEIVEDEQVYGHQELHALFTRAVQSGFGQLIEQGVGLAVEHAVALLDGGLADGLSQMTFAGTGVPRNRASSWRAMNAPVARSKTRLRFIFLLKAKSKLSRVFCESRNCACLVRRSSKRSLRRAFVGDQAGEQIDGGERFGLGLAQTGLQHGGHSAQAKLFESTFEFNQIHSSTSLVL